jgi:tRNA-modifying protein YgfZ
MESWMSFDWRALNGLTGAVFEDALPVHLGNLNDELSACRNGLNVIAPLVDRAWVYCSGADAKTFLHNQLTSDINHLVTDRWQHSSWCTAKGRMLGSFIVVRPAAEEGYLLQMAAELAPPILKRLKMFVLRSKVALEDNSEARISFGLAGKNIVDALRQTGLPVPAGEYEAASFVEGFVVREAQDRYQVVVASQKAAELWAKLSAAARQVGLQAWRWLGVRSGIPLPLVRQATQEEFVPQMVNFDKIGGVSFHKGCYPGQEIIARTQYLGKVKRHLYWGHADQVLAGGVPLFAATDPQQSCGVVVDAAPSPEGGWDALVVMLENAVDDTVRCASADGQRLYSITSVAA